MTFNSIEFLIFYPTVLLLYFILPRAFKWPLLLIASYFFYAYYNLSLLSLIIITTLVSWSCALMIERCERRIWRRLLLAVTLTVCLGILFFYKYFDFISLSIADLFGAQPYLLDLILPVGISFYTFQTLSYVIDVYRGEVRTEKNPLFYALFVSFFPQLVAGPIERPSNLIPQLKAENKLNAEDFGAGIRVMLLGFFKKICVADLVAPMVNSVYNSPEGAGSLAILLATVLFAVQIYCDFSGYTDIAIGCSRIMGIRLMKNFDHPYRARTVKEFWSRWHISLSTWFRDYLYIPLGGNRCKRYRHLLNILIVFLVSGLWHGAAWTFVIWGALHGIYQIVGSLTYKTRSRLLSRIGLGEDSLLVSTARRIMTFTLVTLAWVFFRANSLGDAATVFCRLFSAPRPILDDLSYMGFSTVTIILTVISILTLLLLDSLITYEGTDHRTDLLSKSGSFIYVVWAVLIVWLLLFSGDMISTFIYFAF
ncbi:MAG: MBOAT family protein [Clostridia bacterium]|nr:MBOAT family protein [Clostridia bacterium]